MEKPANKRGGISAEVTDASKVKLKPVVPKTDAVFDKIGAIVQSNLLFDNLAQRQVDDLINRMFEVRVKNGDTVINQGDEGDNFYVVFEGEYDVYVNGNKVGAIGPGKCFGELALLYNSARAATIKAASSGKLWAMDRHTYRAINQSSAQSTQTTRVDRLKKVAAFADLDDTTLSRIAAALVSESIAKNKAIITKGEMGDKFYILMEGSVIVGDNIATLSKGATFGERALLTNEPRDNSVTAAVNCELLTLGRKDFQDMLGPLEDVWKIQALSRTDLLKPLSNTERMEVCKLFQLTKYKNGQLIISKGDEGTSFLIVEKGQVDILDPKEPDQSKASVVSTYKRGDYFGERSLILGEPRAATAVARGEVHCLTLSAKDFTLYLEPLKEQMKQRAISYGTAQQQGNRAIGMPDLEELGVLGVGSFGFVRMMRHKASKEVYALKALKKEQILATQQQDHVVNEKNVLKANVVCDFLGSCQATFQDTENLYMLMPLLPGGELFSYLRRE